MFVNVWFAFIVGGSKFTPFTRIPSSSLFISNYVGSYSLTGRPSWLGGKESTCHCRRRRFNLGQPTPLLLPVKSHGQRNLAGYSAWGHKRVGNDSVTKNQKNFLTRRMWIYFDSKDFCCILSQIQLQNLNSDIFLFEPVLNASGLMLISQSMMNLLV